ncbi:MAG: aminodeoxychorismate lyase [Gammaproteobacteria bacterium]|nr:aminodeoxychorismate lyase [Gammaproteobacteria bacterium]
MTLINGETAAQISVNDRGLLYGDGVFETMTVYHAQIPLWDRHWQRLVRGCERLAICLPSLTTIETELTTLCTGVERAVVKLMITRGSGSRGYASNTTIAPTRIMQRLAWATAPASYSTAGVDVCLCRLRLGHQPLLAGIKHLNRLEQVLARAEWHGDEFASGIVCDVDGLVIEAIAHNVFIIEAGRLLTPALERCGVAGVMRAYLLEHAASWGVVAGIDVIPFNRLQHADEVFLCNSVTGIWPVRRIEQHTYPLGPVTKKLTVTLRKQLAWL